MARSAQRRANDERFLNRRLTGWPWQERERVLSNPAWRGSIRNTGKRCSCPLCSRRRKWEGATMQEQRQVAWMRAGEM